MTCVKCKRPIRLEESRRMVPGYGPRWGRPAWVHVACPQQAVAKPKSAPPSRPRGKEPLDYATS